MIKFLTLILLLAAARPAVAQLQITRTDAERQLTTTTVIDYEATNANGTTFDLGSGSSGRLFDFTGYTVSQKANLREFADPSTTQFGSEFPAATHAQIAVTEDGEGYVYYRIDNNGLYQLGMNLVLQGMDVLMKSDPERPLMLFPMQVGSSWNYKSGVMTLLEGVERVEETASEVVASGTLRLSQGDFPALLVREWDRSSTKIAFGGQVLSEMYTTSVTYTIITKNGISATMVIDTLDENSTVPRITELTWSVDASQTSVESPPTANGLAIDAPYPNPAHADLISFTWSSQRGGAIQLSVTDVYGRVVRVLREDAVPPGRYSERAALRALPAGQYFLRLKDGTGSTVRPLTIVR